MIYNEGDDVEVWDGDLNRWVPGVVQAVDQNVGHLEKVLTVATDGRYQGLPLTYGVPESGLGALVRLRVQ